MKFRYFLVFSILIIAHIVLGIYYNNYTPWYLVWTVLGLLSIIALASMKIGWNFYLEATNRVPLSFEQLANNVRPIALSFDDGPHDLSNQVLDILREKKVPATFFVIGKEIEGKENILKRMVADGHLIGNHSYSHEGKFYWQSSSKMKADILECNRLIEMACAQVPNIFRPPFGVTNPALAKALGQLELQAVGWTLRSFDTVAKDPNKLLKKIVNQSKANDTILLHDRCAITVEILPELIDQLKAKGFTFTFPVKMEKK